MTQDEIARLGADVARLGGGAPLALAVSGGPDSMALLALAAAALPGGVLVATVDHQLRPEAATEAAMVAAHCARVGVPHTILLPHAPIAGASIQAQAHESRYALLADWARGAGASAIATAHHADDQAETFLMRAARASGVAGLAGIRARVDIAGMAVIRPLLDWRRAELRAIVRRAGLPFVNDPANSDPRHDRTRFRRLLEENEWLDPPGLARAAAHLAQADAELAVTADWMWATRAKVNGGEVRLTAHDLPRELARRLVRRAVGEVMTAAALPSARWSEGANVEPLLDALFAGSGGTRAGVQATARRADWRFRPAKARRRD